MGKITGGDKVSARLKRMTSPAARSLIERALYVAGQMIEVEAEISITAGSVSGKGHVPSSPGAPPNADTRDLDSKIQTVVVSGDNPTVHVEAYSDHAMHMEYGTSSTQERPFMRPAAARKGKEAVGLVRGAVDRINRGGA